MTKAVLSRTINAEHGALNTLLASHQEALLERATEPAYELLVIYRDRLNLHIRQEEELLFPHYQQPHGEMRHWPLDIYRQEHERIRKLVATLLAALSGYRAAGLTRSRAIALLEREAQLKQALEHHHQREETSLLPTLENQLDAAESERLAERIRSETDALAHDQAAVLATALQALT